MLSSHTETWTDKDLQLDKFLDTGERGALLSNAAVLDHSADPTFDWMTLCEARRTRDRILQKSMVTYNPSQQVIVFVFLLSDSGNSMAVWRCKCPIPEHVRVTRQGDLERAIMSLPTDVTVYVDECVCLPPQFNLF